jgi:hypothetical protein
VLVVVAEHFAVPGLSPSSHTISEYVNAGGVAGAAMVAGFVVWASSIALTAVLVRTEHRAIAALLALAVVGALVTAAFPTQTSAGVIPPGEQRSVAGTLHDLGSGLILVTVVPAALLSLTVIRRPTWFRPSAFAILAIVAVVATALLAVGDPAPGIRQRIELTAACGWQLALLAALSSRRTRSA